MGRWGNVNCSPIGVAMEKYHSVIGNRLSKHTTSVNGVSECLLTDFSMLTLDSRHVKIRRYIPKTRVTELTEHDTHFAASINSEPIISVLHSSFCKTASEPSTASTTASDQVRLPQGKMCFRDRLAQALFKKRHKCRRCKRKSRYCVTTKTFNGIEKHYTCSACHEASKAVRNLFDSQSGPKDVEHLNFSPPHLLAQHSKDNASQILVSHCKDSGYETVTSCSTVASESSKFTKSPHTENGVKVKPKYDPKFGSTRFANMQKLNEPCNELQPVIHKPNVPIFSLNNQVEAASKSTTLFAVLAEDQQETQSEELRQIKQRNAKEYDGYLPNIYQHNFFAQNEALAESSNIETSSQSNLQYHGSRLVKLNTSEKGSRLGQKECHTCSATSKVFFRLPWENGWICEDCLDRLY